MSGIDPFGLLTVYGGVGVSGYFQGQGNISVSGGAIIYSDQTGWLQRLYGTIGIAGGKENCTRTTRGAGVGGGSVWGFFTGTLDNFSGSAYNLTIDTPWGGITYTTNGTNWGLSIGPAKGLGLGYYMNESYTVIWNPGNI